MRAQRPITWSHAPILTKGAKHPLPGRRRGDVSCARHIVAAEAGRTAGPESSAYLEGTSSSSRPHPGRILHSW
eukprot:107658-Rhodomonas_salina.2